jgi:hypothetical protein
LLWFIGYHVVVNHIRYRYPFVSVEKNISTQTIIAARNIHKEMSKGSSNDERVLEIRNGHWHWVCDRLSYFCWLLAVILVEEETIVHCTINNMKAIHDTLALLNLNSCFV